MRTPLLFLCLAVTSCIVGCESGQAAREVARNALAQEITYEKELNAKIAAEERYYSTSQQNIAKRWGQFNGLVESGGVTGAATIEQARIAKAAANIQPDDLVKFGQQVIAKIQAARAKAETDATALKQNVFDALAALDNHKEVLAKVRKNLEALQQEPSSAEKAKEYYEFIVATKAKFDQHTDSDPKP